MKQIEQFALIDKWNTFARTADSWELQLGAPAVAGTGLIGAPDELQVYYANILWQRQRRNYVSAQRNVTRNWNMCRNVIDFLAEQRKEQRVEGGKASRSQTTRRSEFSHNYASLAAAAAAAAIVNFKKETCQVPQEGAEQGGGACRGPGTCLGGVGEGVDNE